MFIVGDLEADGLLDKATTIWCGTFYDTRGGAEKTYHIEQDKYYVDNMLTWLNRLLNNKYYLVGHNLIGYDLPLINKLKGVELPQDKIIDTYVLSRMFFPDIKGHKKPHSIEAWGERFGIPKPEHEDWSKFSPEMLNRNKVDVVINTKLFELIQKKGFKVE